MDLNAGYPDRDRIRTLLLLYLQVKDEARTAEALVDLADCHGLSEHDRTRTFDGYVGKKGKSTSNQKVWKNKVTNEVKRLRDESLMEKKGDPDYKHDRWSLTLDGRGRAEAVSAAVRDLAQRVSAVATRSEPETAPPPVAVDDASLRDADLPAASRGLFTTYRYLRDTKVAREAKRRAGFECQMCRAPGIPLAGGGLYAEAHHIVPLHRGGPDALANLLCVCPSCHAKLDYLAAEIPSGVADASPYLLDLDAVADHNARVSERDASDADAESAGVRVSPARPASL